MTSSSSSSPEIALVPAHNSEDHFSYKNATHEEVLEDLSSRFILNLPDEELASLERICFQVEQAHWFYEDFIREENPKFPSLPLKKFSAMLFHACPLLHQWSHDHEQAFNTFMQYKTRVPVCGAIMLNDTWEKCVLVKGWKSSSGWGFPKGKINEDEATHNCAIREVLEETGYNITDKLNPRHVIEMSIREQKISLYIVPGVPEDFPFQTRTRKEISKIQWFRLTDLPTWKRNKTVPGKFYLISPFIAPLRNFINERKPHSSQKAHKGVDVHIAQDIHIHKPGDESLVVYPSDLRHHVGAQESSSQSSSTDTGDPQTPSPHYVESKAHPVGGPATSIAVQDDIPSILATQNLDPHFARLLSSLTMSATTEDDKQKEAVSVPPVAVPASVTPSSLPLVSLSVPSHSSRPPSSLAHEDDHEDDDWSARTPMRLSGNLPEPSFKSPPKPPPELSPPSVKSRRLSRASSRSFVALPSLSLTAANVTAIQSDALDVQPPMSATLSVASPTSTTSSRPSVIRRPSSTADISPYLSQPTEVPASGKRLKQLALLESIADESARMTPALSHRQSVLSMNGLPSQPPAGHVPVPGPSLSVPPTGSMRPPLPNHVIYSSGAGNIIPPFPPPYAPPMPSPPHGRFTPSFRAPLHMGPPHMGPPHMGPFQMGVPQLGPLPPSLSAPHHRHSTGMSMNQSQLLSLLNSPTPPNAMGARVDVVPRPSPSMPSYAAGGWHPSPVINPAPRLTSMPPQSQPHRQGNMHPIPPAIHPPPPPGSIPLAVAPPSHVTLPSTAASDHSSLLSILNGKGATASLTGNASMMSSGIVNTLGRR